MLYLISTNITPNKIYAAVAVVVVLAAVAFFWLRSRSAA